MRKNIISTKNLPPGQITVCVSDEGGSGGAVTNALVSLYDGKSVKVCAEFIANNWDATKETLISQPQRTDDEGCVTFPDLVPGKYVVCYGHYPKTDPKCVEVQSGCITDVCFTPRINLLVSKKYLNNECKELACYRPQSGDYIELTLEIDKGLRSNISVKVPQGFRQVESNDLIFIKKINQIGRQEFKTGVGLPPLSDSTHGEKAEEAEIIERGDYEADEMTPQPISGNLNVSLTRTETSFTGDMAFWTGIRNSTEALSFNNYLSFMDWIFCGGEMPPQGFEASRYPAKYAEYRRLKTKRFLSFTDSDAYRVVKAATEAFVMVNCGIEHQSQPMDGHDTQRQHHPQPFDPDNDNDYLDRRGLPIPDTEDLSTAFNVYRGDKKILPYLAVIRRKLPDIPIKTTLFEDAVPRDHETTIFDNCFGLLQDKLTNPCLLELIWSYWHEEGMLVQTMNAITRRFQNVHTPSARDPLANLEMDPLRPLNNLFWGYIQDEQHRLTVARRSYEYDHHYGLRLEGKAVQNFRSVDTRSKFLEAFHHLLRLCTVFYKQDDDTTVMADAFPVLNALKEVHLILSQGAHNQFGDLPSTSRIEMLMQQWFLARPEFQGFLPTRLMVAYPEPWMDRVDAMKKLQGWDDTSVLHFRNLGMFGEQILLSIRWGHWSDQFEPVQALNWARFFRPQVQGYIHAYRAVTGVDLSADPTVHIRVDSTLPSVLLKRRLAAQQRAG